MVKALFNFLGFVSQKKYEYISSRFFENQPNEICSHFSEKASKGRLFGPDKLQNHSKGKENEKEREGRKHEKRKKTMVALSVFIMATLKIGFGRKKNKCWTQKVHLVVTFSNTRLGIAYIGSRKSFLERKNHYTSHEVCKCDARNYQRSEFLSAWWWREMSSKTPSFPSYKHIA